MNKEIRIYNQKQTSGDKETCDRLATIIGKELKDAESKIWHANPVWFLDGNPIVGYSKQKAGIRLMFWSGSDFKEADLAVRGEKFKDASIFYNNSSEIEVGNLKRWLKKSKTIQWDYKNIVKRKGVLVRLRDKPKICSRGHKYQESGPCPICWPGRFKNIGKKKQTN
ncbi:MAG: DUF1801 domain-containing protein [Minisyncoccia bacterium]